MTAHEFTLVIKGDAATATAELFKRVRDVRGNVNIVDKPNCGESILRLTVQPEEQQELYRWLNSGPDAAPFPDGTLLYFSEHIPGGGAHFPHRTVQS